MTSNLSPLVTIGLPVFNGETHIHDAIDSVLSQNFTQFKLVIADNCSTDSTPAILKQYALKDSRISVIRHKKNIGGLENLFYLSKNISTPYFMWFAHDDVMENNFLSSCVETIRMNNDIDMVFTGIRNIDINGHSIREYSNFHEIPHGNSFFDLIKYIFLPEYNGQANLIYSLYKTSFLVEALEHNKNTLNVKWGPDVAFIFSLIASRAKIRIIPKVLFNKRCFQPESEVGIQLPTPSSYLHSSVEANNYHSLRDSYIESIFQYKRSLLLIVFIYIRHALLSTLRLQFNIKNFYLPYIRGRYHEALHRKNLYLKEVNIRYHLVSHKINLYCTYLAKRYPFLRKLKRLIFRKRH